MISHSSAGGQPDKPDFHLVSPPATPALFLQQLRGIVFLLFPAEMTGWSFSASLIPFLPLAGCAVQNEPSLSLELEDAGFLTF